jgi:hypothetical protein
LLLVEVALMVTVLPLGAAAGAVNVATAPLGVCAVIEPQAPTLPQVNVQSTPASLGSLVTVAFSTAIPLGATESVAGATLTVTGSMVMFALTVFVGSVTEVAITVTVPPLGTADGAV